MCKQDCYNCNNSMIIGYRELWCPEKDEIVNEDGYCEDYN